MNTRQQTREGEANERQEANESEEERDNLAATLRGQGQALTAIQQALLQGQATQDKVVEMLAMLLAERNEGRQTTGSPAATRAEESSTVTPTEGALNATEGPEIERMQAIQLKGGKVRPSERMTTATVELIRGVMGTAQSIFTDDNALHWTLEQVNAKTRTRTD